MDDERKEVEIIFEDELDEEVSFHHKKKFTLRGKTMFDILVHQEDFQFVKKLKRSISHTVDIEELKSTEKWRHPLIIDMKEKIEEEYGMRVKSVVLNLYKSGEKYTDYTTNKSIENGVFIVTIGGDRVLLAKNNKTKSVSKYIAKDGDLFFFNDKFNNTHKYSIPKVKGLNDQTIVIVFFV